MGDQTEITRFVGGCVVAFAALLAYSNTFSNGFVWDDASSVLIHQDVQDPARVFELFKKDQHAYGRGQGNFYRPFVSLSFMVDYALAGGQGQIVSPFLFHVTNLFWHALAAVLLMVLLLRLGAATPVAAAVSVVYAAHPIHTEAVTYISGRADSMAAACMFAALSFALWKLDGMKRTAAVAASGVAFAVALLCKESALIYTPLLLLCAAAAPGVGEERVGTRIRSHAVAIGVGSLVTVLYAVLRSTVLSFGSDSSGRGLSLAERIGEVLGAFALYMKLTVLPTGLHMERVLDAQPLWQVFAGLVLLAGVCIAAYAAVRAGRVRIAAGLGWFLLSWLPISGIVPLNAPMAEHWLYVPIAGLLWAAAEFVWPYVNRGMALRFAGAALTAVVLALVAVSVDRNQDWRDNETIYTATLAKNPNSIRVNYNLAVTYEDIEKNQPGAQRHFERVIELYAEKRSTENSPEGTVWTDELDARLSLGRLYLDEARFDLAFAQFAPLTEVASQANAGNIAARAAMGLAICYVVGGQSAQGLELVQRIATTNYMQQSTAYYRRTFAVNRRIADEMKAILLRVSAMQQTQEQPGAGAAVEREPAA